MRSIRKIHTASYVPIANLVTYSPLPSAAVYQVDPFLFLNHHGHQIYSANNTGLPFGPHPHRGMETVTFILEGDIMHADSNGNKSVIEAGGVQWMTAGSGLIHAEVSSDKFKRDGGGLEILQLWVNLPARLKMTTPSYHGLQKDEIPTLVLDNGRVEARLVSGMWDGHAGAFDTLTDVALCTLHLQANGELSLNIPAERNILFYVIHGDVTINNQSAKAHQLVEFNRDEASLSMHANHDSIILFGHAQPLNEPIVAQGPFVMNTEQEIIEAYNDYRQGKFGHWH